MHVDPLSDVLALRRPQAYGFRGLDIAGEWSLHLPADDVIRCYALSSGACGLWVGGEAVWLTGGDLMLLPHGDALVMGSSPDAPPIDLDAFFATAEGETAVISGGGGCSGLGGYFELGATAAAVLLKPLPTVVRLEGSGVDAGLAWLVERLMRELRAPRPGGRLIAEHLSQTLLVEALRLHLASAPHAGSGWLAGLADPRLAGALGAIHGRPGERWTLAALARIAGLSRSAFAQRFTQVCGEPAMAYLARWRMLLAADRLARGEAVGRVARDLGYGSESAFGAAFRRISGVTPARHSCSSRHVGSSLPEVAPSLTCSPL